MAGTVSCIVTTKNSERTIAACLDSIRAQTYPDVETIVVDNESADRTVELSQARGAKVITGGPERSAQRNIGVANCAGEYVLILDSDMILEPNVVEECVRAVTDGLGVAIPEQSFGQGYWSACKAFERSFYVDDALVSAARFFRSESFRQAGGYDLELTGPEDWDLSMRICGLSGLRFAKALILHDEGRQSLGNLVRKKYYYGKGYGRFAVKHGPAALARLSPFRSSLIRSVPKLAAKPVLGAGVVTMKAAEFLAVVAGSVSSRLTASSVYRAG